MAQPPTTMTATMVIITAAAHGAIIVTMTQCGITTATITTILQCNNHNHDTTYGAMPMAPRSMMPATPHYAMLAILNSVMPAISHIMPHPRNYAQCDSSNRNTKHGTTCFRLSEIICAYRLA
jgi:hypothetical protein